MFTKENFWKTESLIFVIFFAKTTFVTTLKINSSLLDFFTSDFVTCSLQPFNSEKLIKF